MADERTRGTTAEEKAWFEADRRLRIPVMSRVRVRRAFREAQS
jgi:hypothetical protein